MKILVTNDDGIFAPGLWRLARELKQIAQVTVAAPDREQSGSGTAVTLRQPLRVQKVKPLVPEIEAYSVEGTPIDSVLLALGKLLKGGIDLIVSGINSGPNLGDDVLISGTVGAALMGYLHDLPALAFSIASLDSQYLDNAAGLAAQLAKRIVNHQLEGNILLNINLPSLPLEEIRGIRVTKLASKSHIDTVEEGHDGRKAYYWLVRQKLNKNVAENTDIWAIAQGNISITPLNAELLNQPAPPLTDRLCADLLRELRQGE
ncbi:5'/3'-nucleotidase SurE [Chloroflexota bacterium]